MIENAHKKKIGDLVEENYQYASVLYNFGIHFYESPHQTLEDICRSKGLNLPVVVAKLENLYKKSEVRELSFNAYPIKLVVAYLKHTHHLFIRHKLPYMLRLIQSANPKSFYNRQIAEDLQLVFPLFAYDFISHIHHEEDTLFAYIDTLDMASKGLKSLSSVYYQMERHSIHQFAVAHQCEDDEMDGIRTITSAYYLPQDASLHMRVIYAELQAFEEELSLHAGMEDEILMPKALRLENEVKELIRAKAALN
jgi:regulator of cell morphogenesis and NO signaling